MFDSWLERLRRFWNQRLDALGTELARGRRERREHQDRAAGSATTTTDNEENS